MSVDGKFGAIYIKGDILIPLEYQGLKWRDSRNVFEAKTEKGWGIIDDSNRIIIPFEFDNIEDDLIDGYIVISDDKYGVVSHKGIQRIPTKFKQINVIRGHRSPYSDSGYHVVDNNLKSAFFNISGKQETGFVFDEYEIHGTRQPIKVKIGETSFLVNVLGQCVENCPLDSFLKQYGLTIKE